MKINMKYTSIALLGAWLCMGCASHKQAMVQVEPVNTLLPDSAGTVWVDVHFNVPAQALHRRSRLIIVPQWMSQGHVYAEYRPVVLNAPIYTRKLNRRTQLYGYQDTLQKQSQSITTDRNWIIPYREKVTVPAEAQGGHLVAMISTDGCGTCNLIDTLDMAYLTTMPRLIDATAVRLGWIERDFVVRPKVMEGKGEALLQFVINRHDINLELGHNKQEMLGMLSTLQQITGDSLATLQRVAIYGMASADGSLTFNTGLASRRANAAKQWLVQQLHLPTAVSKRFQIGSRPEGWEPVLAAMRADRHPDTLQVSRLLERYAGESDDKAEYHIRRLACWNDIKAHYLQKDRKVEYEYNYRIKSFTDDHELLLMYRTRPDAFNEEELLRVAMLQTESAAQEEVYRTTLHYFPESATAAHNLAVLLMRRGATAEAVAVLKEADPIVEIRRAKAAAYLLLGQYKEAIACVNPENDGPEARYHAGLAYAQLQQYKQAYRCLSEFNDGNAALVSLCAGENDHAWQQMQACSDTTPRAAYIRALIAARRSDKAAVMQQLQQAVADSQWATRASGEVEFRTYWNDADFQALMKGGMNR